MGEDSRAKVGDVIDGRYQLISMLGQGGIEFGRALFGLTPPAVPCENRRGLVYGPETAQ
jgi:hypothetical protein